MRVLVVILFFLINGCVNHSENRANFSKIDSASFENRALVYFIDSLFLKEGLFGVEIEGFYRDLPFMDSGMYENGLFKNKDIFYSLISASISSPPIDSSEVLILPPEEARTLTEFYSNFRNGLSARDTVYLLPRKEFNVLSWFEYVDNLKENPQGVYLIVHRNLSGGKRNFVQLEFRDVDQRDMYFTHNFYVELDAEGQVVDWRLTY